MLQKPNTIKNTSILYKKNPYFDQQYITYIRFFSHLMFFPAKFTLNQCRKFTQMNFSRNPSNRNPSYIDNLLADMYVKFTLIIFPDSDILRLLAENGCMVERKPAYILCV